MKTRSFLLAAGVMLAMTFTFSCDSGGGGGDGTGGGSSSSGGPGPGGGNSSSGGGGNPGGGSSSSGGASSFVPIGKGNNISSYRTVEIGDQTWMAENLNYTVPGSKCYDNSQTNCDKYGQLYDWSTAMGLPSNCNYSNECSSQIQAKHRGVCPSGWHIPSHAEWGALLTAVGGSGTAGTKLKATSGWDSNGNGTDDYEFSALPGGRGLSGGGFNDVGSLGHWWSATAPSAGVDAYSWRMYYDHSYVLWKDDGKILLYSIRCVQD